MAGAKMIRCRTGKRSWRTGREWPADNTNRAHKPNDDQNGRGVVVTPSVHVQGDEIYPLNTEHMTDKA